MKIPQLEKKPELKSCHNVNWEDNYSWVHQSNILEVLRDSSKLVPQVRNYLEEENAYTEYHLKDTKDIQKQQAGNTAERCHTQLRHPVSEIVSYWICVKLAEAIRLRK